MFRVNIFEQRIISFGISQNAKRKQNENAICVLKRKQIQLL